MFDLARAVTHWVGFESACNREHLLSEASLINPVGQFLNARTSFHVRPERPYPGIPRRRIDVTLIPERQSQVILHAFEMKFLRASGRDYTQEVFDDIIRLETINGTEGPSPSAWCWFLVAGVWADLMLKLYKQTDLNSNTPLPESPLSNVLPNKVVEGSCNDVPMIQVEADAATTNYWKESQSDLKLSEIPKQLGIKLQAMYPKEPTDRAYTCMIWRVARHNARETFTLVPPMA